jgi:cytosine/adenosine deaminase-related metal-dependent hydrolase
MIIKNGYILQRGIVKRDILIEGNTIAHIDRDLKGDEVIDASGMLVLPDFVNTHTHLAMTLFRGYADDMLLEGYCADLILIDLKHHSMVPPTDLVSNSVYSMNSSAVDTAIIDGTIIMQGRKILAPDEEDILEKAQAHAHDLLNR